MLRFAVPCRSFSRNEDVRVGKLLFNKFMWRSGLRYTISVLVVGLSAFLHGQTFVAADGVTVNTCSGTFHDSGGPSGNYGNAEDITFTICPSGGSGSGPLTSVTFSQFDVQLLLLSDELVIHDGTSTADPVLATGGFLNNLTGQSFTATGASGCLTFHFTSDLLITAAGWTAAITTGPSAGVNASTSVCANGVPFNMFARLGGTPDAGGTWTGPGGPHGATFDPAVDASGAYVYTVSGPSPCPDSSATLTVTKVTPPNAGGSATTTVCTNASAFSLFSLLTGTPDAGGAWTGPGGTPVVGTFTPGVSTSGIYTYTVLGTAPCGSATATVTVSQVQAPDAGASNSITVCSDDAVFTMLDELGGTPDAGGTWVGPNGPHGGSFDPATDVGGAYIYTVSGSAPCAPASSTLTITVRTAPDAGADTSITVCSSDASFQLFDRMGGDPDPGGTWTGPGGAAHPGTFIPGSSTPGAYTYTVVGQAPCTPATATITVGVSTAPFAGNNASVLKCSNDAPFSLFAQLGGTANTGGTWTGPNGPHSATFTPGVDDPGAYTYTVVGSVPCPNATAVVNVSIVVAPNAGVDGDTTVCSNNAPFQLFALLGGGPDLNGTWTAPGGGAHDGTFTPGSSTAGIYSYTVPGQAPCANDVSTVTVDVVLAPVAGTNGTITVCSDAASVDLFALLGGAPNVGGTWTRPNGTAHNGTYLPGSEPGGTYTYTVAGTAPCANASASVQVVRIIAPNAGTNGSITVCSTNGPFDLISVLGGSPNGGGFWLDPALSGVGSTFTPGTSAPGIYAYVVAGTAPCGNDTAFATVNVNTAPNAGANAAITVCSSLAPFDLFDELAGTPDAGGTWTRPNGTSHSGTYTPGTSQPGGYTYTVPGQTPCVAASAVVVVSEVRQPIAGTDGSFERCSTDGPVQLVQELGGSPDAGGTWVGPGATPSTGVFIPGTSEEGVYTYTVVGAAPCTNAIATVTATVNDAPDAGEDATTTVCADLASIDLFTVLLGTPETGGTWSDDDNTGQLSGQFFSPPGLPPGNYDFTYTVPGNGQCGDAQATVRVTIVPALNAGSNGSMTVCSTNMQVNLFNGLGGSPQQGGTWVDLSATGQLSGQFFNANGVSAGVYAFRYELAGTASCTSASAQVTVTVVAAPNAGTNGTALTCSNSAPFNMFTYLGGNPQGGGMWFRGMNPHPSFYDPQTDMSGVFSYRVSGSGPCSHATATVTVTETQEPDAGTDNSISVCATGTQFNMTLQLGGSPQPGSWTFNNQPHSNIFVPGLDQQGIYVYTVQGQAPCAPDVATLTISVSPAPNAGTNGSRTVCDNESAFLLFGVLGGGAQPGGTWLDPLGDEHDGLYVPGTSTPGDYLYTVPGNAACPEDVAVVSIFENPRANAGGSSSIALCAGGGSVNLLTVLSGNPSPTGTWTGPGGPFNGTFTPGVTPTGLYTYTVFGAPPCPNASATVSVSVSTPPVAGGSNVITVCTNTPGFAMLDRLTGTPQLGGIWTGPAPLTTPMNGTFIPGTTAPGSYTYTVTSGSSCPNATATLNIIVNTAAYAGEDAGVPVCSTDGALPLQPLLGGSAQAGGSWSYQPTHASHGGIFFPSSDQQGTYVYTVTGPPGCANDSALVSVVINQAPNAGFNGLITLCDDQDPLQLIGILNGSPALNGNWIDPMGNGHTGIYLPGSNDPGVYTYTVNGVAPCANASAQVTVIENHAPDAGQNGVVSVCSDQPQFPLFDHLTGGPEPGGQWFAPNGTQMSGTYVPGSSEPGVYKYRIAGIAPCTPDSATVTVIENLAADAGVSTAVPLCSSSGIVALIDLLGGTPQSTGSWTFNGDPHGPNFNPAVDIAGAYVYTVTGNFPCVDKTAQVQISLTPAPFAGNDGTLAACVNDPGLDLTPGLGTSFTPDGTWLDVDMTGQLTGSQFSTVGIAPGVYRFTYVVAGLGPCTNDSAFVSVVVADALDAGEDAAVDACETQLVDLFSALDGTPQVGGIWLDTDVSNALIGGVFNAGLVAVGTTWRFDYVLGASAQCESDTARVTVTVLDGPNAGCGSPLNVCSSEAQVNLASSLSCSPDGNGTWFDPVWAPHSGLFLPSSNLPGTYHYVVPGIGNCPADTAHVTVSVVAAPNAGFESVPYSICSDGTSVAMFSLLGPDAQSGGSWVYVTGGNVPHSGIYNPAVDQPGTYRYTVQGQLPCANDFALVTVSEPLAPNAGCNAAVNVCSSQAPFVMRLSLDCSPQTGGTWRGPDGPHGTFFDPASDTPGVYTYRVAGIAPCLADSATLTIAVTQAASSGPATVTIAACASQTSVDLLAALGPTAQPGGSWTELNSSGALAGNIFNPSITGNGSFGFRYAFAANGPCPAVSSTVTVNVGSGSSAGQDSTFNVCGSDAAFALIDGLAGAPDPGGTWSDPTGTGALLPGGLLNATLLAAGTTASFTYTVVDPGCGNVSASVTVTITEFPDAGVGTSTTVCTTSASFDLFDLLGGTPATGGTWTNSLGVHGGTFIPGTDQSGPYTYTVEGNEACDAAVAVIDVTANIPPDAGTDGSVLACDTVQSLDLFEGLQGAPQTGGTWQDLDGSGGLTGGLLNTTALQAGQYRYRYTLDVTGCGTDEATVTVRVVSRVRVVQVNTTCNDQDRTYTVTFVITDGDPASYAVSGLTGTLGAGQLFTSDPILTSADFEAFITDQYNCEVLRLTGESPCDFDDDVFVPQSFSPNDDGINEALIIPGIEGYPLNSITIFNRWGAEVYAAEGYDNVSVKWDGTSPDALMEGRAAAGTYFYVLDLGTGKEPLTGYIYLNR